MARIVKTSKIMVAFCFLGLLIVASMCSVNPPEQTIVHIDKVKLKGLWYYTTKYSQYAEVYFGDSIYFSFQDDNYFVAPYLITGLDSLEAQIRGQHYSFKISDQTDGAFTASTKFGSTNYYKIQDTVFSKQDWVEIFQGSENPVFRKYRSYYLSRRQDFVESNK